MGLQPFGDGLQGGDLPAREDALVDPGVAAAGGEHAVMGHGDRLQPGPATRGQQPVDGGEVGGPVPFAHGLDHLHRQDHVVVPAGLAVIAQLDVHLVGEARGGGSPAAWVDTPGVAASLPRFRRLTRPVLLTPEQGADTIVWLATAPPERLGSGRFWHDRRPRPEHLLVWTREKDPATVRQLWDHLAASTASARRARPAQGH
jgi:hypothetical protein